jgi:hypothetical protein
MSLVQAKFKKREQCLTFIRAYFTDQMFKLLMTRIGI